MARVYPGENKALHPATDDKKKGGDKKPPDTPKTKPEDEGKKE